MRSLGSGPGLAPASPLALIAAKIAGSVLEARGKADELFPGKRKARQPGHLPDVPGKLFVVLPIQRNPSVFVSAILPFWQKPVAQSLGGARLCYNRS